ncbi:phosphoglycerate mutase-like protein [Aulographum hederae CBS 113979]|uniref:Phosphoglycerate mutase-like protein n=1 Tax=Aulographum hederae CBS 113979 TaxID=1176131 RepID=A0A6G1GZC7_9PEZI|nr:phosphoglycerate mutase-like protein [Aulographum hederae CBS 113979]
MTTFKPLPPYSKDELQQLYPESLQLQLVQVILRHGMECVCRSPVNFDCDVDIEQESVHPCRLDFEMYSHPLFLAHPIRPSIDTLRRPDFRHAQDWPYCKAAKFVTSTLIDSNGGFDELKYRRRIETFGADDSPAIAKGPESEVDAICRPGELTDEGRETTLALGQRLRRLYVDQLHFMPDLIHNTDSIYLRATPIPRALESVQQTFAGMYPRSARTADFPPPIIFARSPADETLFPNETNCRRFAQLARAFAQRAAGRWNESDDMSYLNKVLGKWMPETSPRIAVDSHPRLSGIMDTVNSTLAHGPATRLPKEFYDPKVLAIIDKIGVEEWFAGYTESREYRALGIGGLLGDIVGRMVEATQGANHSGATSNQNAIKLGLSGCHDTTLAGLLTSLGAFDGERWPPYTSHIAMELFKQEATPVTSSSSTSVDTPHTSKTWFSSLFPFLSSPLSTSADSIPRKPAAPLTPTQSASLDPYFVRIRYNDRVMRVPGCAAPRNHLEGDASFCTLKAFKEIVDDFVPADWRRECGSNLDAAAFPVTKQPAGFPPTPST